MYAGNFVIPFDTLDIVLRLVAATLIGMARGIIDHPDALSRVLQGVDQGVLVGIGFLGGGILMRDPQNHQLFNLPTAAEVWAVAAMGLATACAPWAIVGVSIAIFAILMVALRTLKKKFHLKEDH